MIISYFLPNKISMKCFLYKSPYSGRREQPYYLILDQLECKGLVCPISPNIPCIGIIFFKFLVIDPTSWITPPLCNIPYKVLLNLLTFPG